jgi:hypothetical protein
MLTKMREDRKADHEDFLARMHAFHEERMAALDDHQKRMMAKTESNQKKAEEDRKADKGRMDADRRAFIEWMKAKTKATQAETKAILAETKARREKRMEANTNDDRNESTACEDVMEARLEYEEPASGDIKGEQNETTACMEMKDKIEENPEMMQSVEEHHDAPSEDVAVMPVKGLRKRRRGRKSTAGRREQKELTRGNCGSREKLAAACRKVPRHAAVVWRKRKLFRKSETRGFCGSRIGVTVTERRTSSHATVAWRKRKFTRIIQLQENHESSKDVEVNRVRKFQGCKNGVRCRDVKEVPDLKKERTTNGIKRWSAEQRSYLGTGRTPSKTPYEIFGGKIEKLVVMMSMRFLQIRIWRVWRDRPPPKRKKKLHAE